MFLQKLLGWGSNRRELEGEMALADSEDSGQYDFVRAKFQ
jgi:hypothetical protein